jgi:hypothetical protein
MSDIPTDQDGKKKHQRFSVRNRPVKQSLGSLVLSHILVIFFCIGFPAMVTGIAPVSWIKFERRDGQVSATAKICLFFVVPYRTIEVFPVIGVGDRFVEGTRTREERDGRTVRTKSENEGFLVIKGTEQTAEVPVSPFSIKSVVKKTESFLKEDGTTELNLFVVANWKFSVIAGGLVSLLTVLYVFALIYQISLGIVRIFKWALGISPHDDSFSNSRINGDSNDDQR